MPFSVLPYSTAPSRGSDPANSRCFPEGAVPSPPPALPRKAIKPLLETPSAPTGRAESREPWARRILSLSGAVMDYCHLAAPGLMIPGSGGRIPEGKVSSRGHGTGLVAF